VDEEFPTCPKSKSFQAYSRALQFAWRSFWVRYEQFILKISYSQDPRNWSIQCLAKMIHIQQQIKDIFIFTNLVLKWRNSACWNSSWIRIDNLPSFYLLQFFSWFVNHWSLFAFKLKCKLLKHLGELFITDSLIKIRVLCLNVLVWMDLLLLDDVVSGTLSLDFTFRLR